MTTNGAGAAERNAEKIWARWKISDRGAFVGICQHRDALWEVRAGRGGDDDGREVCRRSQVNALTGASPTVALHVLWDLPGGKADVPAIQALEKKYGVRSVDQSEPVSGPGVQVRVDRQS